MTTSVTCQAHLMRLLESKISAGFLQQTLTKKSQARLLLKRLLLSSISNNSVGKVRNSSYLLKAMMKITIRRIKTSWKVQLAMLLRDRIWIKQLDRCKLVKVACVVVPTLSTTTTTTAITKSLLMEYSQWVLKKGLNRTGRSKLQTLTRSSYPKMMMILVITMIETNIQS